MFNLKTKTQKSIKHYSYFLNDKLGEGYQSKVYKGTDTLINKPVAIKVIEIQSLTSEISQTLLRNEITILKSLNHKNLMAINDIIETKNNIYLICEYCNQGDLSEILLNQNLTHYEIIDIMTQIANGVQELHNKNIIHRDIKPANILKSDGIFKLADFGFAIIEDDCKSIIKKYNVGTPVYMSPETAQFNFYSEKCDIWSMGIILYYMIYKEFPFNFKQDFDIYNKYLTIKHKVQGDSKLPKKLKDLLIGSLEIDPNSRHNIHQIISILQKPKTLKCNMHESVPCKIIRGQSSHLQTLEQNEEKLKTLMDDISEISLIKQTKDNKNNSNQHYSTQQSQDFTNLMQIFQNQIKQQEEQSESKPNSIQNSTNDTIKASSNCKIQFSNKKNGVSVDQRIPINYQKKQINLPSKSVLRSNQSMKFLTSSPIIKKDLIKSINLPTTDIRYNQKKENGEQNFFDAMKKYRFQEDSNTDRTTIDQISITIRPTYKFIMYLNKVWNYFDSQKTNEKNDCFFLLKKLQAMKSKAIKQFCPNNIQEVLELYILDFQKNFTTFSKNLINNNSKFSTHFNNDLDQFTKGFSHILLQSLQQINEQQYTKELFIIQQIINENLKQFNDPILFARRWEGDLV